jgi:hypothetical protein
MILHETLAQYLAGVEQAILRCSNAYVEHYTEEILTPQRANLRIRLRFEQGHLLEINAKSLTRLEHSCQDWRAASIPGSLLKRDRAGVKGEDR